MVSVSIQVYKLSWVNFFIQYNVEVKVYFYLYEYLIYEYLIVPALFVVSTLFYI